MEEIGQERSALVAPRPFAFALAALVVAVASSAWAWRFAIDDAWISIRYARHLAAGAGYVWNVGGASTDGVTPLPWALMLAPLSHAAPPVVLGRARLMGALVWALAATVWGASVGRANARLWVKVGALALLALDVPVAAHAVSGMETAFAMALATLAALLGESPYLAATCAGVAASLRPELAPWGIVVAVGFAKVRGAPLRRVTWAGAIALAPFTLCALTREVFFGRPAPLSLLAKPSDLAHGLNYAGGAALFCLAPIVLFAPWALAKEHGRARVLAVAAVVHFSVVAFVGGDWMPYARLIAPIVPSMLFAAVLTSEHATRLCTSLRLTGALLAGAWFFAKNVEPLRQAGVARAEMIAAAPLLLSQAAHIAAVDIGWVSAVTEAPILDLAGVTDPDIATLPGGHTSKRVDPSMLLSRGVDVAVFYAAPLPARLEDASWSSFPRVVEARLVRDPLFTDHFAATGLLSLGGSGAGYVIFTKR